MRIQSFLGVPSPSVITPPVAGYVLAFNDDFTTFNGNASGTNGWQTTFPDGSRDSEASTVYVDPSVIPNINPFQIVSGTQLAITASSAAVTGANSYGFPYNSGMINSQFSFKMTYGYFEARMLLAAGQGLWPAFWTLGGNSGPPELDAMEMLGNAPTTIYSTVQTNQYQVTPTVTDSSLNWHTYAMDWEPGTITFKIDGIQTGSFTTPAGYNTPLFMIANFAVGGLFPGPPKLTPPNQTPFPSTIYIDWIRAWKSPNSTNISGTLVIP